MPPKKTSVDIMLAGLVWKIFERFYNKRHVLGTLRASEINPDLLNKKNNKLRKKSIEPIISDDTKRIIYKELQKRTQKEETEDEKVEGVVGNLFNRIPFLQSLRGIFSNVILRLEDEDYEQEEEEDEQEEQEEEEAPIPIPTKDVTPKKKKNKKDPIEAAFDEDGQPQPEPEPEPQPELKQPVPEIQVPFSILTNLSNTLKQPDAQMTELQEKKNELAALKRQQARKTKTTITKKVQKPKPRTVAEIALGEQLSKGFDEAKQREIKATQQRQQISSTIVSLVRSLPKDLQQQYGSIVNKLNKVNLKDTKTKRQSLGPEQRKQIINNIPVEYRNSLRPSVDALLGGRDLNLNEIAIGMLGLSLTTFGGTTAGIGMSLAGYLMSHYNIKLNDYVFAKPTVKQNLYENLNKQSDEDDLQYENRLQTLLRKSKDPKERTRIRSIFSQIEDDKDNEDEDVQPLPIPSKQDEDVQPLPKIGQELKMYKSMSTRKTGTTPDPRDINLDDEEDTSDKTPKEIKHNADVKRNTIMVRRRRQLKISRRKVEEKIEKEGLPKEVLFALYKKLYEKVDYLLDASEVVTRTVIYNYIASLNKPLIWQLIEEGTEPLEIPGFRETIQNLYKNLPSPEKADEEDTRFSGVVGAVAGAAASAVTDVGFSAQDALSGVIPGAVGGLATGMVSSAALRTYYKSIGKDIEDPKIKKRIKYLTTLPVAVVAGMLGFKKYGQDITSGAGITESKINIDRQVLAETRAQINQEPSNNKQWKPKSILPSTAVLDQSRQEKYADDLEFIAFNYIPPTSEGGYGTVDTNPLKRNQMIENEIRFTKAGVFVPYDTWNQMNDTNNISEQRVQELALGQKPIITLPEMRFIAQDNADTFENVAQHQYVNNENTAIEWMSPYNEYSNVDNFWMINENSKLFTINP